MTERRFPERPSRRRRQRCRTGRRVLAGWISVWLALVAAHGAVAGESDGTEHWLAFTGHGSSGDLSLRIVGEPGTAGTIEIPGLAITTPFTIPGAGFESVALSGSARATSTDGTEALGVRVTSDRPVVVFGFDVDALGDSAGSFLALPVAALGTDYRISSTAPDTANGSFHSQFAIVATADGTSATVTTPVAIGVHPLSYVVALDAGDVYQAQSDSDLTGSTIAANAAVAVYSGNDWNWVPAGQGDADLVVEQIVPTAGWGTEFFAVPPPVRATTDQYLVVADENGTAVALSTGGGFALDAGQFVLAPLSTALRISSSKPISVAQVGAGGSVDDSLGDPSMLQILPSSLWTRGHSIVTADDGTVFPNQYVTVVAPAAAVGLVALDGARIASKEWTEIGATGVWVTQQSLSSGRHRLTGPIEFGASVYGFGDALAYGHPAGAAALPFVDGFEAGDVLSWSSAVP